MATIAAITHLLGQETLASIRSKTDFKSAMYIAMAARDSTQTRVDVLRAWVRDVFSESGAGRSEDDILNALWTKLQQDSSSGSAETRAEGPARAPNGDGGQPNAMAVMQRQAQTIALDRMYMNMRGQMMAAVDAYASQLSASAFSLETATWP